MVYLCLWCSAHFLGSMAQPSDQSFTYLGSFSRKKYISSFCGLLQICMRNCCERIHLIHEKSENDPFVSFSSFQDSSIYIVCDTHRGIENNEIYKEY